MTFVHLPRGGYHGLIRAPFAFMSAFLVCASVFAQPMPALDALLARGRFASARSDWSR